MQKKITGSRTHLTFVAILQSPSDRSNNRSGPHDRSVRMPATLEKVCVTDFDYILVSKNLVCMSQKKSMLKLCYPSRTLFQCYTHAKKNCYI